MKTYFLTASTLHAILAYTNPTQTPKIAYDRDDLALPLIDKIKESVGDLDGSKTCSIHFKNTENELHEQFVKICSAIADTFMNLK